MRTRLAEPKHSFSIYLPTSLYQKLVIKAGKGQINTFINQVLEKELAIEEKQLILAYQRIAQNQKLKKEIGYLGRNS
jgi:hypothetical protein